MINLPKERYRLYTEFADCLLDLKTWHEGGMDKINMSEKLNKLHLKYRQKAYEQKNLIGDNDDG